jgi:hypothetical protein
MVHAQQFNCAGDFLEITDAYEKCFRVCQMGGRGGGISVGAYD